MSDEQMDVGAGEAVANFFDRAVVLDQIIDAVDVAVSFET